MDIEIKDLSVSFPGESGRQKVLYETDLMVKCGKITAIVGESGSGKSILGAAVMGLLDDSAEVSGSIRYGEMELLKLSEKELNRIRGNGIGWISQDPIAAMNPLIRIGKQVVEAVCFHKKRKKAEEKEKGIKQLETFGLEDASTLWSYYPHELSGGMAQRVLISMMTFPHPEWLIADEPTKGLDAFMRKQVADAFRKLQKQGMGILLITHDLRLAECISDDIVIMYSGQIIEKGKTDEVFKNPLHPYTRSLFNAAPDRRLLMEKNGKIPPYVGYKDMVKDKEKTKLIEKVAGHFVRTLGEEG